MLLELEPQKKIKALRKSLLDLSKGVLSSVTTEGVDQCLSLCQRLHPAPLLHAIPSETITYCGSLRFSGRAVKKRPEGIVVFGSQLKFSILITDRKKTTDLTWNGGSVSQAQPVNGQEKLVLAHKPGLAQPPAVM